MSTTEYPAVSAADTSGTSGTSWVDAVDQGIRTSLAVVAGLGIVSTVAITPPFFPHPSVTALVGLGLIGLGQALIVLVLWRLPRSWGAALTVFALTVAGLVLAVAAMTPQPSLSDTWWPRSILVTVPAFLILGHRRGWTLALGVIGANTLVRLLAWQPNPTMLALTRFQEVAAELGQILSFAAIAFIAGRVTTAAAHDADVAVAASRRLRDQEASGRLEETRSGEADRFVHDEVLHTLRMVAMERSVIPATAALEAARRLRRILEIQQQAPTDHGLLDEIRQLIRDLPLRVTVTGPEGISLPRDVAQGLGLTIRECLRNVVKHAGTTEAEVTVRRSGFALSVTITDEGRGFDPALLAGRLGLRESVMGRMADAGGSARIVSAEGRGTTVYLRWSPIPMSRYAPREIGGGAVSELFPSIGLVIAPVFVQGLWAAMLLGGHVRLPAVDVVLSVATALLGALGVRQGLRSGMRAWQSVALGLFAWACTIVNVLLLPVDSVHPRLLWLVIMATGLPSVISLFRPLKEAVIVGVGISVLTLITLLVCQPNAPLAPNTTVLMSPLITIGIAFVVRRLVDRCAFEIWTNEERLRDATSGLNGGEYFTTRLEQRLLGSKSMLVEFLDHVVAHPSTLEDEATREQADRLERGLRDVIALSVDPALGSALTRLRLGGWTLRSRWGEQVPSTIQQGMAQALDHLPATAPTHEGIAPSITLTATQTPLGWRSSLLVRPAVGEWVDDFAPGAPWQVHRDDGLHAVSLAPMNSAGHPGPRHLAGVST